MRPSVAPSLVPPWLEPLLSTQFFAVCPLHVDSARNECNMFCVDCGADGRAFCFYCRSDSHSGHGVIQIRRSSYHDVVRVAEIQNFLDIAGVQTYVINSARVLFLNERPQPRGARVAAAAANASGFASSSTVHTCEICARSLLDPFRFCSLGCKLVRIQRNGDSSFVLSSDNAGEATTTVTAVNEGTGNRRRGGDGSTNRTSSVPSSSNSRRRKGTPQRAPFFSS